MPTPACQVRKAVPDPGALSAIPIETKASPCPMNFGAQSTHTIELTNNRPFSIYNVEFISKALFSQIEFSAGSHEWLHDEPVIRDGSSRRPNHSMQALAGSQGKADEIECKVKLHDATQKKGSSFSDPKSATDLTYSIDIL